MYLNHILAIFAVVVASCGPSKESAANEKLNDSSQKENAMQTPGQDNKYRLIVSFISIGEGTDPDARKLLDGVIENWNKKSGKSISFEPMPWGREGEVDFCFRLVELSSEDQVAFINEMKKAMEGRKLIQFAENQEGRFKN